jgi:hypothetical protein
MKYLLTLVTLLFIGFSSIELYAQGPNYLSGLKPIQFDDIKGMEITITDLKDENRTFYYEVPDTLWIKESKEPRLNKHYKIIHIYKGIESENGLGYYTPADAIIGRTFLVEDITYSKNEPDIEIPSNSRSNIFTCRLKDTTTGEIIYMKIEDKNLNSSLKFKARDITLCNDIIGKKYVRKLSTTGTPVEIKDCFYNFNSLWSEKTIELKTMGGTIIYQNQLEAYTTIEVYKLKQERIQQEKKWKQIEEMANDGNYKICVSSVQKPSSNKFSKGELVKTDDGIVYTDNHISLIITPQDDRFLFSINNKSQSNIEIDWDRIIYINENNHSSRVIHSGIKYADKNSPQVPSLVAPKTSITDAIIPADNIYLSSVSYEWRILSLLKNGKTNGSYDGRNVKINLPIKINGVSYEYVIVYDLIWKWKNPEARKIWLEHINAK